MVYYHRLFAIGVVVALTCLLTTPVAGGDPELEWAVQVGDSMTYCVLKCFDSSDFDGDGNVKTVTHKIRDDTDSWVNVTLKLGSRIKYIITQLDPTAKIKKTYDGEITSRESLVSPELPPSVDADPTEIPIVTQTVDNQSYWEAEIEDFKEKINISLPYNMFSLEGDELIYNLVWDVGKSTFEWLAKRNWRTGWITSQSLSEYNDTYTYFEYELGICPVEIPADISGFELTPLFLGISLLPLVISRKRRSVTQPSCEW